MPERIKLIVEYDGTNYSGWQRQINAMSVQQRLEEGLKKLTGESITVTGSSRTPTRACIPRDRPCISTCKRLYRPKRWRSRSIPACRTTYESRRAVPCRAARTAFMRASARLTARFIAI